MTFDEFKKLIDREFEVDSDSIMGHSDLMEAIDELQETYEPKDVKRQRAFDYVIEFMDRHNFNFSYEPFSNINDMELRIIYFASLETHKITKFYMDDESAKHFSFILSEKLWDEMNEYKQIESER